MSEIQAGMKVSDPVGREWRVDNVDNNVAQVSGGGMVTWFGIEELTPTPTPDASRDERGETSG